MKPKLIIPNNIFSKIFLSELSLNDNYDIEFLPAALIAKKVSEDIDVICLIPSLDL